MKYIGSNCTINQSIKFGVNFKIETGCILAMRRIATGSGFEHAGGTPLPISKASIPPGAHGLKYTFNLSVVQIMSTYIIGHFY